MSEYQHHVPLGQEAVARCNELMTAPPDSIIDLPDGRRLEIRDWNPVMSCDAALSVNIRAFITTEEP